ncbi:Holliday junction DNA helicase RuvB [Candidatus Termititenax persephonae]|uniref:Holliday junction branch migration complex subunit RuvB n=1 Tax=Candidatus Termititenax persephonae TaxID=2218525 RepID=A0A388TI18_9BACT|nr:Holliday junction DNA helicase RuvB [Candidatus Termititenax persephonae]
MVENLSEAGDAENAARLIDREAQPEDALVESIRPRTLDEYIGQGPLKENLRVFIHAARSRQEPLEHLIFYGPPGLGKTTLANVIANEMGVSIKVTSGPAVERPGDLAAILTNLQEGDVFFIDEIHRLNHAVEEVLYAAMEDFELDIMLGKGASARSLRLTLPKFTLIGATTRVGLLSAPLRDRFGILNKLEFYTEAELGRIVQRSARILGVEIGQDSALAIAQRSRATPRIANRLIRRIRDWAQVKNDGVITPEIVDGGLQALGIDRLGLDGVDRKILSVLIEKFNGGPVGLDTLAAITNEDALTLEDVYEPYLLQLGFIDRTPRGRICLPAAYQHLGKVPPSSWSAPGSLF